MITRNNNKSSVGPNSVVFLLEECYFHPKSLGSRYHNTTSNIHRRHIRRCFGVPTSLKKPSRALHW